MRQSEFIYETEKARALRVQLLLLEDENFTMQDQLADAEEQVDRIRDDYEETVEHLGGAEGQINTLQNELKIKLRELETYKVNHSLCQVLDSVKRLLILLVGRSTSPEHRLCRFHQASDRKTCFVPTISCAPARDRTSSISSCHKSDCVVRKACSTKRGLFTPG